MIFDPTCDCEFQIWLTLSIISHDLLLLQLLSLLQIIRKKTNTLDLCQFSIIKIHTILQAFCFLEACPFCLTKQTQP